MHDEQSFKEFDVKSRKGVAVHDAIIDGYFKSLTLRQNDKVLIVDLLPNRFFDPLNVRFFELLPFIYLKV